MPLPALLAALLLVAFVPLAAAQAAPCAGFTDVTASDPFCGSVAWMKNRAITLGCTSTMYCPDDFVTRKQMAAFMYRLGVQNAFLQGGNAFGVPAQLGTTDSHAMEVLAGNARAFRIEPDATSPNVLLGHASAGVYTGVHGGTIGGGGSQQADPNCTTGYGCVNGVSDHFGTVGGGESNKAGNLVGSVADATHATVGGGFNNAAQRRAATVAGGTDNVASGFQSTIGGGSGNQAANNATVAGGAGNIAADLATVIGGAFNHATGQGSIAGGFYARAVHDGCIVLADYGSAFANATTCGAPNQFIVRARGGVYFFTGGSTDATYTGVYVNPGSSSWLTYSDRAGKHDVAPLDPVDVAERVAALPLATWRWNHESGDVRHMGPMAQDFHAAFGLGPSNRHIATVDADGVALAAIQGLHRMVKARDDALARQQAEIDDLRRRLDVLAQGLGKGAPSAPSSNDPYPDPASPAADPPPARRPMRPRHHRRRIVRVVLASAPAHANQFDVTDVRRQATRSARRCGGRKNRLMTSG